MIILVICFCVMCGLGSLRTCCDDKKTSSIALKLVAVATVYAWRLAARCVPPGGDGATGLLYGAWRCEGPAKRSGTRFRLAA